MNYCQFLISVLQPGKVLTKTVDGKFVPKAGSWAKDNYHLSKDGSVPYERALVDYLLGAKL